MKTRVYTSSSESYHRVYFQATNHAKPERRKFQLGELLYFRKGGRRGPHAPRLCYVVSFVFRGSDLRPFATDSFYTVHFLEGRSKDKTRRLVSAYELSRT